MIGIGLSLKNLLDTCKFKNQTDAETLFRRSNKLPCFGKPAPGEILLRERIRDNTERKGRDYTKRGVWMRDLQIYNQNDSWHWVLWWIISVSFKFTTKTEAIIIKKDQTSVYFELGVHRAASRAAVGLRIPSWRTFSLRDIPTLTSLWLFVWTSTR